MFDTAYYLHYVLDSENDSHYTDDLMCLSPERYLWHQLKEHHDFKNIVFVSLQGIRPVIETFDTASEQFLRPVKKGLFGIKASKNVPDAIVHKEYTPADLKQETGTLLEFLLECQQNAKKAKTALVLTMDALEELYSHSTGYCKSTLDDFIRGTSGIPAIMVIRLGMNTNTLHRTFLGGSCLLAQLDRHVAEVLRSHVHRPLLTMLSEQLGSRLVNFCWQKDDILNMLLMEALANGSGEDSPAQLRDQAEYLRLCLCSQLGLAWSVDQGTGLEPLKRATVYAKLKDASFRSRLREEAAKLRIRNAGSSMTELFQREFGVLPDDNALMALSCQDELAAKVRALTLPEEYQQQKRTHVRTLEALRTAVTTLWNNARNEKVCNLIRTCCDRAQEAAMRLDWDTLTDAMTLLSLCARQICADPVLNDNLDEITETGVALMYGSADYFQQRKDFRDMYPDDENAYFTLSKDKLALRLSAEALLESEGKKLSMLRSTLYNTILYFNDNPRSEKVEQTLRESLQRWRSKLDQVQADEEFLDSIRQEYPTSGMGSYDDL